MENLNINRDKPEMTDDQILKHKNFDAVMNAAQSTPFFKTGKFWGIAGGVITTAVVATAIIMNAGEEENENTSGSDSNKTQSGLVVVDTVPEVQPLAMKDGSPYTNIDFTIDQALSVKGGATLNIPANSIIGLDGENVPEGMYNWIYDAETAIEVLADKGGEKAESFAFVPATQEQKIVDLGDNASMNLVASDARVYIKNEEVWQEIDGSPLGVTKVAVDTLESSLMKPIKGDEGRSFAPFDLGHQVWVDISQMPELSAYKNEIRFQTLKKVPSEVYEFPPSEVTLSKVLNGYLLTLTIGAEDKEQAYEVIPVFVGDDFDTAEGIYQDSREVVYEDQETDAKSYTLHHTGQYTIVYN